MRTQLQLGFLCLLSAGACARQAVPASGDDASANAGSLPTDGAGATAFQGGMGGALPAIGGGGGARAGGSLNAPHAGGSTSGPHSGGQTGVSQGGGRPDIPQANVGGGAGAGANPTGGAVGGSSQSADGSVRPGDASGTAQRSTGCGQAGQKTGDLSLSVKDGSGTTRDFELLVPASVSSTTPLAVTFVFHGSGGTSANAKAVGIQQVANAASQSIFVFPQGINFDKFGVGWNDGCSGYDMVFFDNMLGHIEKTYCVDPERVFVAGFSWGCDFVTALACCRGNRLRAVGAASCSDEFSKPSDYTTYANYPCPVTNAAAIRFTHDSSPDGDGAYSGTQFASTSRLYREMNACSATTTATSPSPCVAYQGCRHSLVECAYPGLGHAWPSDWATETWSFFARAP